MGGVVCLLYLTDKVGKLELKIIKEIESSMDLATPEVDGGFRVSSQE